MFKVISLFVFVLVLSSQVIAQRVDELFIGQVPPEDKSKKFKIGNYFESKENRTRCFNFAFSPNGKELFFSHIKKRTPQGSVYEIKTCRLVNNQWTEPVTAGFSGEHWDVDINFSPDGNYLFFASDRPTKELPEGGIFYIEKTKDGWGEPQFTGNEVSSEYGEVYPSLSNKGNLFFRSTRPGGFGGDDLYRADWRDGEFTNVRNLGSNINTQHGESNAVIAPDESYIVFCSTRPENGEGQKILVSFQIDDNKWTKAIPLGSEVNATRAGAPTFSADGKYMFFSKPDGHYWISTGYILKHKPEL